MYTSSIVTLLCATLAAASPLHSLNKREPSDKSGKAQVAFVCSTAVVPNPGGPKGEGEGGAALKSSDIAFFDEDGNKHGGDCEKSSSTCNTCKFSGNGLKEEISVEACQWDIASTCSIEFEYDGYTYDSEKKQPWCGHEGGGFKPFSNDETAICYFDV